MKRDKQIDTRSSECKIVSQPGSPRNLVQVFVASFFIEIVLVTSTLRPRFLKTSGRVGNWEELGEFLQGLVEQCSCFLDAFVDSRLAEPEPVAQRIEFRMGQAMLKVRVEIHILVSSENQRAFLMESAYAQLRPG